MNVSLCILCDDHRLKLVVHNRFSFIFQVAEEVSILAYLYVYVGPITMRCVCSKHGNWFGVKPMWGIVYEA